MPVKVPIIACLLFSAAFFAVTLMYSDRTTLDWFTTIGLTVFSYLLGYLLCEDWHRHISKVLDHD